MKINTALEMIYLLWIYNTATVTIDSCSLSHNGANTFLNLV